MDEVRKILDRVAELNCMFLAIDGKEKSGEKMGGIAWHGRKSQLSVWLALNMELDENVKEIILGATNVFLNRYKEGKKAQDELEIYELKIHTDK